jgi:hypothetical protein
MEKPKCPVHKTEMQFSTKNIDQGEIVILLGKVVRNQFYYCSRCDYRYSSDLGGYFDAKDLPSSRVTDKGPLSQRK